MYVGVRTLPRASITSAKSEAPIRYLSLRRAGSDAASHTGPMRISVEPSTDPAAYPLHHRIRVRFAETDAMQIVHHGRYLPYLEEARVAYLRHIGHPYTQWREQGTDSAVLEAYVRYVKPLRFDDEFDVHIALADVTRTTFQMAYLLTEQRRVRDCSHCPRPAQRVRPPNPPAGVADRHAWTTVTSVPCCFRCYDRGGEGPSTGGNPHGYHRGVRDRGSARDFDAAWEPRIGVLVVAYNAEDTLAAVLDRLPESFRSKVDRVLVADDASHDATHQVGLAYQARDELPLTVIRHERNLGYGGNQKSGYRWAIAHGLDIVVLLHGDGQYAPEVIEDIVAPLIDGRADAVFGSRMMTRGAARAGGMPLYKYVGNRVPHRRAERPRRSRPVGVAQRLSRLSSRCAGRPPFESYSDGFDFDTEISSVSTWRERRSTKCPSRPTTGTRSATSTGCAMPRT